jgi:hypothetical protein
MQLADLLTDAHAALFQTSGKAYIQQTGRPAIEQLVFDIMCGGNLRDATETLTRQRISDLNLSMLVLFLNGSHQIPDFTEQVYAIARQALVSRKVSKMERWLAQWILGLTDKATQNVLRSDTRNLDVYLDRYRQVLNQMADQYRAEHGELTGTVELAGAASAQLTWKLMVLLFSAVGAQTMAVRGSDKSIYGKLFEKLILGSLLHALGFTYIQGESSVRQSDKQQPSVFWLSSRGAKRESDATALYNGTHAIRFDLGFIGSGNTEISLDKVSRFERYLELKGTHYRVTTIIIVDRVGKGSRIPELARELDGYIVQMSASYWPITVARILEQVLGWHHPVLSMTEAEFETWLQDSLRAAPLADWLG